MAQIFSIILVIAMAFSSVGGLTGALEEPVSFETKISVDAEALTAMSTATGAEATEESLQTMKVVGDIVSALTLKGIATKDTAELDLLAGEDVALSIGVKTGEEGATVASSLLGTDVVLVSQELIDQYKQEMMNAAGPQTAGFDTSSLEAVQNLDMEQILKDIEEVSAKLTEAINAKIGETEEGEFVVDELAFTARTPVNMTLEEFTELLLNSAKELAGKESLKPVFEATGKDIEAEIDKALETIRNDENKPEMDLAVYTDADNCTYCACDLKKAPEAEDGQEETIHFGFGDIDNLNRVRVAIDQSKQKADITAVGTKDGETDVKAVISDGTSKTDAAITAKQDAAGNLDMVADIKSATMNGKIVVKSESTDDERKNFTLELYMGDAEKAMITFSGSAGKGGEPVSVFEGEGVNVIPFETLMNSEDQTAASQLQMKLMAGLLKGITVVSKNVPEDTATWISTQVKQMMYPTTTTTK